MDRSQHLGRPCLERLATCEECWQQCRQAKPWRLDFAHDQDPIFGFEGYFYGQHDCINRPDRRLHPTERQIITLCLQRGSHPQRPFRWPRIPDPGCPQIRRSELLARLRNRQ